jgi:hypothetical protein
MQVVAEVYSKPKVNCSNKVLSFIDIKLEDYIFHMTIPKEIYDIYDVIYTQYKEY